jgi:SpoVK/Ycf46/Vps4 family AAA+-type ATPase
MTASRSQQFEADLRNYIRARYALIQLVTFEESRAMAMLVQIAAELGHEVLAWSTSSGVTKDGRSIAERTGDLKIALDFCEERARNKEALLVVLLDPWPHIGPNSNPVYQRRLKEFATAIRTQGYRANCLLVGPFAEVPASLQKEITLLDFPLPDRTLLRSAIEQFAKTHRANPRVTVDLDNGVMDRLVEAALGLTVAEIENCLARSLVEDLRLDASDITSLLREKQQTIRKSGVLDYVDAASFSLGNIGGLENLKRWLHLRNMAFGRVAQEFGVAPPKGVLVCGVPGCGKSLTAKCVASSWNLPLLKLDMGKVFHGLVGSSEANIRNALATAEAISPTVLWIDEIEKGLAGAGSAGGDAGTAVRVFGTLLTWMQEKTEPVFVFATANDIAGLPPELLRKGRFDEVFFVDLPTPAEREEILSIQLTQHHRNPTSFDLARLSQLAGEATFGDGVRLTGAEIEAWVGDSLLEAFRRRTEGDDSADLSMNDFESTVARIVPLAQTRKAELLQLRAWASQNAVSASQREHTLSGPHAVPQSEPLGGRVIDF